MKLYLRLRTYGDQPGVAWLALGERHATGRTGLLAGSMPVEAAERLAAALGLPVERDHTPDPAAPAAEAKS